MNQTFFLGRPTFTSTFVGKFQKPLKLKMKNREKILTTKKVVHLLLFLLQAVYSVNATLSIEATNINTSIQATNLKVSTQIDELIIFASNLGSEVYFGNATLDISIEGTSLNISIQTADFILFSSTSATYPSPTDCSIAVFLSIVFGTILCLILAGIIYYIVSMSFMERRPYKAKRTFL